MLFYMSDFVENVYIIWKLNSWNEFLAIRNIKLIKKHLKYTYYSTWIKLNFVSKLYDRHNLKEFISRLHWKVLLLKEVYFKRGH